MSSAGSQLGVGRSGGRSMTMTVTWWAYALPLQSSCAHVRRQSGVGVGGAHTPLGRITRGLPLIRAGIFVSRKFQSQLLLFFFHSLFLSNILIFTIRTNIIQGKEVSGGNFRQLLGLKKNYIPSHPVLSEIMCHSLFPLTQRNAVN